MFSIKGSLVHGWERFKAHWELMLTTTLFMVVAGFLSDKSSWILSILLIVLSVIVRIGYTKIVLRLEDGELPTFKNLFTEYSLFWRYLGTSILQGLVIVAGFILLIVPGIIWAIKYSFAPLILIDTNTTPLGALKESAAITKGKKWQLLGFYLVLGLVNIAGIILLGVGLLVSIPVSTFAMVYVYRKLSSANAAILATPTPISPQAV